MPLDLIDYLKKGKFRFAEAMEDEKQKTTSLSEMTKRLIFELRAFADVLDKEKEYFNRMSAVYDRTILTQDQIQEFRTRAYRLDANLEYVRRLLDPGSKLSAILDHAKRASEELKAHGITSESANNIMHRELVPSLKDAIKAIDVTVKELDKMRRQEDAILKEELAIRRLL
ncbi:hypothetical protein JW898_00620 [Candidatus Woesearchaeota archaeon]|nr:hypothetical protein [Candidatus Woesearchaeota archaeon]